MAGLISRTIMQHKPDESRYDSDDGTFNFRVNKQLKTDFEYLCKRDHMSVATALKRYMRVSVREARLK